jgi:hypothetical protein
VRASRGYGFRRVERVHVQWDGEIATAYVTAISHRYPWTVRVPMDVAVELVGAGVPLSLDWPDERAGAER